MHYHILESLSSHVCKVDHRSALAAFLASELEPQIRMSHCSIPTETNLLRYSPRGKPGCCSTPHPGWNLHRVCLHAVPPEALLEFFASIPHHKTECTQSMNSNRPTCSLEGTMPRDTRPAPHPLRCRVSRHSSVAREHL